MSINDPAKLWRELPPMTFEQFDARSLIMAECLFETIALLASDMTRDPFVGLHAIGAVCRVWKNRAQPPTILAGGAPK